MEQKYMILKGSHDLLEKNIKELSDRVRKQQKVIEELNRYNEALIIENLELKKITLKKGVKNQAIR